jgi:tRNA modification GTPase
METLRLAARAEQNLVVVNKCDRLGKASQPDLIRDFKESVLGTIPGLEATEPLAISCKGADVSAVGLKDPGLIHMLIDRLVQSFSKLTSMPGEMQDLLGVTERQRQLLVQCREHLEDFMAEAAAVSSMGEHEPDIVLAAEHLRFAADSLARITGRGEAGDVEEVLGVIFEKYVHSAIFFVTWTNSH